MICNEEKYMVDRNQLPRHFSSLVSSTMANLNQRDMVSQSIPAGYIPPGNPRRVTQKTCPGCRDLNFESCSRADNLTGTGSLWKMKKNSVDQTFTGEKKNKLNFLPFSRFTCFLNKIFLGLWVNVLVLLSHIPYKNSEELSLACLYLKFSLGYGYPLQKAMIMLNVLSVYLFC